MAPKTYLGGGSLYMREVGAATFVKVALVQSFTLAPDVQTVTVMDFSNKLGRVADEAVTSAEATISFETAEVNVTALRNLFLGTVTTAVANPAADTAGHVPGATTVTTIDGMMEDAALVQLMFVSNLARGAANSFFFYQVMLKPDTTFNILSPSEFNKIKFTGRCQVDDTTGKSFVIGIEEA